MKNITKKITRISTVLTASILSAALPLTALAAQNSPDDNTYQPKDVQTVDYKKSLTPEFAYSAEKWATLRDNIMEYGELADLIHEYNPTVLSNRSTYKEYQRSSAAAVRSNPGSDVRSNGNPDRCPYSFKECTGSGYSHFNSKKEPGKCTQKSVPYVRLERRCTA